VGGRWFLPTGRIEHRIIKAEVVELLDVGESPVAKVEAITENVSPGGVRVIADSVCAPGKLVRLDAREEHLKVPARVVYCQRLDKSKFAIGLQLGARVEEWQESPPSWR
jgi:PilZ domain